MTKHKAPQWSATLREWEKKYATLYEDAVIAVAAMDWQECQALRREIEQLGQTNCSWVLYHAARDLLWSALPQTEEGLESMRVLAAQIQAKRTTPDTEDAR